MTRFPFARVGLSLLLVATVNLSAAEKKGGPSPDDQYKKLTPDSTPQPGVPHGIVTKYAWSNSKIFPGTHRDYWIYVPKQYNPAKPACVFVCQDGLKYAAPDVFDNLIARKEMPVTIGIFINPGDFSLKPGEQPRKKPDGKRASPANRSKEYDTLSDDYARFLLEEILPEVSKKYNLTKDPEGSKAGTAHSLTSGCAAARRDRSAMTLLGHVRLARLTHSVSQGL